MFFTKKLPVKLTDNLKVRRVGTVVSSLDDVKRKSKALLQLKMDSCEELFVGLEDGTEVVDDSYLLSLQKNTLLIISLSKPQTIGSLAEIMERYMAAVHDLQSFDPSDVRRFLESNDRLQQTWKYVSTLSSSKSRLSSISEHPEWFTGCNKLVTTKEDYFRKCAQGRIRSYLRDAQSKLSKCNNVSSCKIIEEFKNKLEKQKYYCYYFDRGDDNPKKLCDLSGKFVCQGKYNEDACKAYHSINPYDNAESRILFSTWNLDHVVERTTILADLCAKASNNGTSDYCLHYDLLFTLRNLKLVHKACHVIAPHVDCSVHFKLAHA